MAKSKKKNPVCSPNSSSNWEDLPDDLLDSILEKLVSLSDIIRFSSVCKPWNSKALVHKKMRIHQPPWLFVNYKSSWPPTRRKQSLYNFPDGSEILNFKLSILWKYKHRCCFGSSYGWLFYKEMRKHVIVLLNPFSGTIIRLPPILNPDNIMASFDFINYFTLSSNPCFGSFEVLAFTCLYSDSDVVAHLKFEDKFWTYSKRSSSCSHDLRSLAFYKNCLLDFSQSGKFFSLSIYDSSLTIKFEEISQDFKEVRDDFLPILSTFVETTNGDLLLVHKYKGPQNYKVFKITYSNGQFNCIPTVNLDGHCLFLKNNKSCISILASNYAGMYRENSIYYLYKTQEGEGQELFFKFRIEEFNLEDESMHTKELSHIESMNIDDVFWIVPPIKL